VENFGNKAHPEPKTAMHSNESGKSPYTFPLFRFFFLATILQSLQ
jgi:hypothetical protein